MTAVQCQDRKGSAPPVHPPGAILEQAQPEIQGAIRLLEQQHPLSLLDLAALGELQIVDSELAFRVISRNAVLISLSAYSAVDSRTGERVRSPEPYAPFMVSPAPSVWGTGDTDFVRGRW